MGKLLYGNDIIYGYQHSISQEIELAGLGLMTGEMCSVRLKPLPENSGIIFKIQDEEIKVSQNTTFPGFHNLCLKTSESDIMYIEHLLATLFAFGIDNLLIEVQGPEIPFFDGSALIFSERLLQTGLEEQGEMKKYGVLLEELEVQEGKSYIKAIPSGDFSVFAEYISPTGKSESFEYNLNTTFADEISPARTFIYEQDLKNVIESGIFKGGNLDCAVIFKGDEPINTDTRFPNERVRHKILDFLGDMFSLNLRITGKFFIRSPSHKLTREFIKKLKYVVV